MRTFTYLAIFVTILVSACAGSNHVAIRAANNAGYTNARILSVTTAAPATFGCSTEDSVAYRMRAQDPRRQTPRDFTVCCGVNHNGCKVSE